MSRRHRSILLHLLLTGVLCACGRTVEIPDGDADALVAAVARANAGTGPITLRLARHGLYLLQSPAAPGLLLPPLRGQLRIEGQGAEIRGYTGQRLALLQVERDASLSLADLTLAEGGHGALRNLGQLELDRVHITDSSGDRIGAIVLNLGQLSARDSEIAYNRLSAAPRDAGIVLNYGQLRLARTRIHDNLAGASSPHQAVAGAILNFGELHVDQLDAADNTVEGEPGPLRFDGVLDLGSGRTDGQLPTGRWRPADPLALLAP